MQHTYHHAIYYRCHTERGVVLENVDSESRTGNFYTYCGTLLIFYTQKGAIQLYDVLIYTNRMPLVVHCR